MQNDANNSFALIPQTSINQLIEKINNLENFITTLTKNHGNDFDWIESSKVPIMLGICSKTWQTYRDKRLIPFSQFGKKIFVKKSDLSEFLEKNKIKAIR